MDLNNRNGRRAKEDEEYEELQLLPPALSKSQELTQVQPSSSAVKIQPGQKTKPGFYATQSQNEIRIPITDDTASAPSSAKPTSLIKMATTRNNFNNKPCALAEAENSVISSTPEIYSSQHHGNADNQNLSTSLMEYEENHVRRRNAVLVEHGFKDYGTHPILIDFNMCVEENTIYGLLGASGCGKTTILSCIVALRKLDSGNIFICGQPTGSKGSGIPGKRVGYMPQEIALNGEFDVKEVLQYFGRIYGMSQSQIKERHKYLIKLLSLEKCTCLIRNLSDGQKRRVSLAVALLHEPDILILDEPTVGCDPLLRQSIWKFLDELIAQKRTTVIVTTHYIEETRQADRVGIMRNGRLLVEDSPTQLLLLYNANLLDDIVLKLCQKDELGGDDEPPAILDKKRRNSKEKIANKLLLSSPRRVVHPSSNQPATQELLTQTNNIKIVNGKGKSSSRRDDYDKAAEYKRNRTTITDRLRALIVKNVIVLLRNLWFLVFLVCLPCVTVVVFCATVGSEPIDLKVGVINKEFRTLNDSSPGICQVEEPINCVSRNLSCLYLDSLNKQQIQLIPFDSIEDAIAQVHNNKIWGYVAFGKHFSKNMFARLLLGKRTNDTIYNSQIKIKLDMANKGVGQTLKKIFFDGFRLFSTRILESCSIDPIGRDLPVTFDEPFYGVDDAGMTEFMGPGVALGMIFFMCALTCGLTYIIEKKDGMINRTLVTGVSTVEIMLSHFLTQIGVVLVQIWLILFILFVVFDISCHGSLFLAFLLLFLSSFSGMSVGFLAATFCDDEKNAMLLAMGTVLPSFLLAGLIWPIESAPRLVQYISFLLPGTLIAEAFRSVLLRGFSIEHPVIWQGIIAGIAWTALYWALTVFCHRFSRRRN